MVELYDIIPIILLINELLLMICMLLASNRLHINVNMIIFVIRGEIRVDTGVLFDSSVKSEGSKHWSHHRREKILRVTLMSVKEV